MSAISKKYYSLEEAAVCLRVTTGELMRMREQNQVRGYADRGTWKFKVEEIEEVARSRQADSDPEISIGMTSLDAFEMDPHNAATQEIRLDAPEASSEEVFSLDDDDLGEQPTVIRRQEGLLSSDSDVRLLSDDVFPEMSSGKHGRDPLLDSDSDVRLVGDEFAEVPETDADSDSDVKLLGDGADALEPPFAPPTIAASGEILLGAPVKESTTEMERSLVPTTESSHEMASTESAKPESSSGDIDLQWLSGTSTGSAKGPVAMEIQPGRLPDVVAASKSGRLTPPPPSGSGRLTPLPPSSSGRLMATPPTPPSSPLGKTPTPLPPPLAKIPTPLPKAVTPEPTVPSAIFSTDSAIEEDDEDFMHGHTLPLDEGSGIAMQAATLAAQSDYDLTHAIKEADKTTEIPKIVIAKVTSDSDAKKAAAAQASLSDAKRVAAAKSDVHKAAAPVAAAGSEIKSGIFAKVQQTVASSTPVGEIAKPASGVGLGALGVAAAGVAALGAAAMKTAAPKVETPPELSHESSLILGSAAVAAAKAEFIATPAPHVDVSESSIILSTPAAALPPVAEVEVDSDIELQPGTTSSPPPSASEPADSSIVVMKATNEAESDLELTPPTQKAPAPGRPREGQHDSDVALSEESDIVMMPALEGISDPEFDIIPAAAAAEAADSDVQLIAADNEGEDSDSDVQMLTPADAQLDESADDAEMLEVDVDDDSAVQLMAVDAEDDSDSDVQMLAPADSESVVLREAARPMGRDSDSDVQLLPAGSLSDSDSDVQLLPYDAGESGVQMMEIDDSDQSDSGEVQLLPAESVEQSSDPEMEAVDLETVSDVQLLDAPSATSQVGGGRSLLAGADSDIAIDFVPDDAEGSSVLSDESGLAMTGDSSAMLVGAESGISLEGATDSGLSLDADLDEGITLAPGTSGVSRSGIATLGPTASAPILGDLSGPSNVLSEPSGIGGSNVLGSGAMGSSVLKPGLSGKALTPAAPAKPGKSVAATIAAAVAPAAVAAAAVAAVAAAKAGGKVAPTKTPAPKAPAAKTPPPRAFGPTASDARLASDSGVKLGDSGISGRDSGISLAMDSTGSGISLVGDSSGSNRSLLADSNKGSGITLGASDSGINLLGDDDEGITLAGDSGISLHGTESGVTLAPEDSGIALGVGDSGISLEDSGEFSSTSPMLDTYEEDESSSFDVPPLDDSGDQTVMISSLDDSGEQDFDSGEANFDSGQTDDGFNVDDDPSSSLAGEDDALEDDQVFGLEDDAFAQDRMGGSEDDMPLPTAKGKGMMVAPPAEWDGLSVGLLSATGLCMLPGAALLYDMVRNLWMTGERTVISSTMLDLFGGFFK